ncbi:hypothetical protein GA0061091_11926 [Gordonia sp. v-85]|nr:hypothetical protein GA0061091_11926 [Gordonia sp. v-85]
MMALMTINEVDAAAVRCARLAVGLLQYELEQILRLEVTSTFVRRISR